VTVSAGSPAAARAWLISASTCAAGAPPWFPPLLLAAAEADADADAGAAAVAAGAVARGDGERVDDADGDGAVPLRRARAAACRGGTVTTAGGTATVTPAGLAGQAALPAAPHPAAVVREPALAWPAAVPPENTPRAR